MLGFCFLFLDMPDSYPTPVANSPTSWLVQTAALWLVERFYQSPSDWL